MSGRLRILLADDSRFFRAIESQFLQKTPVDILQADSCEAALAVVRDQKPDLVYAAFSLPRDGGAAFCKAVKQDPATRHLPVVLVCDQGAAEQPEIARRAGSDACLVKPLDRHNFLQVGRKFLEGIREHRQPSFFRVSFVANGETFQGKTLDISGGGMFIETQAEIAAGTLIDLDFRLPDQVSTRVTCRAEVTWLNRKPKPMKPHYPHGLGLKFVDLPAAAHRAIIGLSNKKSPG